MKFIHEDDKEIREWVKDNLYSAVTLTYYEDRFTRFDGEYITKKGNKRYVEVKNRHFNHNKYYTTDINKDKYLEMIDTKCDLIICFDDGVLAYSPNDLINNLEKYTSYKRKDQVDAINNKWENKEEKMACLTINENRFHPYTDFITSPTRKIIPSKYNN